MVNCLLYFCGLSLGNVASALGCVVITGLVGVQRKQFREQMGIPGGNDVRGRQLNTRVHECSASPYIYITPSF